MYVLGIDPGLSRCGYGCISEEQGQQHAIAAGVIRTPVNAPLPERLAMLRAEIVALVKELSPQVVVVERVLFQTNALTAMAVGQASGVALATAAEAGLEISEYSANEVKLAVAGYGSATKLQVQEMVMRLLQLPDILRPPDAADALALPICHLAVSRNTKLAEARTSPAARALG